MRRTYFIFRVAEHLTFLLPPDCISFTWCTCHREGSALGCKFVACVATTRIRHCARKAKQSQQLFNFTSLHALRDVLASLCRRHCLPGPVGVLPLPSPHVKGSPSRKLSEAFVASGNPRSLPIFPSNTTSHLPSSRPPLSRVSHSHASTEFIT